MTSGPFTPPIVLYVIRGLTELIRGSPSAEGIAMAEDAELDLAASPGMGGAGSCHRRRFNWSAVGAL